MACGPLVELKQRNVDRTGYRIFPGNDLGISRRAGYLPHGLSQTALSKKPPLKKPPGCFFRPERSNGAFAEEAKKASSGGFFRPGYVLTIGQILQTPKKPSGLKKPPPNAEEQNLSSFIRSRCNGFVTQIHSVNPP